MSRTDSSRAFAPSAWWVWLAMGAIGLLITIGVGLLFGLSPIDVLLGRELSVIPFIATDYVLFAYGIWLAIRAFSGSTRNAL